MEALNHALFLALNASPDASPLVVAGALFLAKWPVGIAMLLAAVVVALQPAGNRLLIARLLLTVLLAMAVTYVIRQFWYQPRPFVVGLGQQLLPHEPTASFPSFHATFLFSIGLALLSFSVNRVLAIVVLCLGLLTAWARIYLGVHYPFDIIAAFFVAGLATFAASRPLRTAPSNTPG